MRFLIRLLLHWHRVDTLRGLDDHLLRDIGVSRPIGTNPGV
jgi:uncharacterized protein YjiS (DUF1127 family)